MKLLSLAGLLFPAAIVSAAVIHTQPLNLTYGDNGPFSQAGVQVMADDFDVASATRVEHVEWFGSYYNVSLPAGQSTVRFTVNFYKDVSGYPLAQPTFTRLVNASVIDDGLRLFGHTIYRFSADLTPANVLSAGTWWFSVLEADNVTPSGLEGYWLWAVSDFTPDNRAVILEGSVFTLVTDRRNLAFTLVGEENIVPEPVTALLLASGLAALALFRQRR